MLTGYDRLADRYRNKGTAFTEAERDRYCLHGLLPPVVEDLDTQLARACQEYEREHTDLGGTCSCGPCRSATRCSSTGS